MNTGFVESSWLVDEFRTQAFEKYFPACPKIFACTDTVGRRGTVRFSVRLQFRTEIRIPPEKIATVRNKKICLALHYSSPSLSMRRSKFGGVWGSLVIKNKM